VAALGDELVKVELPVELDEPVTMATTAEVVALTVEDEFWIVLETEAVGDTEDILTVVVALDEEVADTEPLTLEADDDADADADADTEPDTELEDEPAAILNGNEYWKVDGLESRVSLKP